MKKLWMTVITVFMLGICICVLSQQVLATETTSDESVVPDGLNYNISNNEVTITGYTGSATELVIPATVDGYPVTKIGVAAFEDNTSLTSVTIPEGVTHINASAFCCCSSLSSVTIPDTVTEIGNYCFSQCKSLTSIAIPASVTEISVSAFTQCTGLQSVYITDLAAWLSIEFLDLNSNPLVYAGNLYLNGELVTELTTPAGITKIKSYALHGCTSLTAVTISEGVTSIGFRAFDSCKNMTSVSIANTVTSMDSGAFQFCDSLLSVVIPDSVTKIGNFVFSGCNSLTSVTISNNLTDIELGAFSSCNSLNSVVIPDSVVEIGHSAFSGCTGLTSVTIPNGVTIIDRYAFENCSSLRSILLPENLVTLGQSAFSGCSSLIAVTVPDSITTIESGTFSRCTDLKSVVFSDGATTIGTHMFSNCTNLIAITIPDSVTSVENYAFYNCDNLCHVAYAGSQEQWKSITIGSNNYNLKNAEFFHYETVLQEFDHCTQWGIYCPVCQENVILCDKEIPEHSYGNWTVITPATFEASGEKTGSCIDCGESITVEIPQLYAKVDQWNVSLGDDLSAKFYLQISEQIENVAQVELTVGEDQISYTPSQLEKTKDGYYRLIAEISAAQMTQQIRVRISYNGETVFDAAYSIREYADTILEDESYSKYHDLIRAMLHYGAAAQAYFGYNVDQPANEGLSVGDVKAIPESAPDQLAVRGAADGALFYGASLVYRDKIAVRFYFQLEGSMTDYSFACEGNPYVVGENDGMVYVEVQDILPQDLDQQQHVTVSDVGGKTLTVSYSPMNYIVRMNETGSDELKTLLSALYNYHLAAKQLNSQAVSQ